MGIKALETVEILRIAPPETIVFASSFTALSGILPGSAPVMFTPALPIFAGRDSPKSASATILRTLSVVLFVLVAHSSILVICMDELTNG